MNVYDFDGTIYNGDSSIDFYLFCLRANPLLIRFLPHQMKGFLMYALNRIDKTQFKEHFFCFLNGVDTYAQVSAFWKMKESRIMGWYLAQQDEEDVIISASPRFLLQPICERLGKQNLIASEVDKNTGKFLGPNCFGDEKVHRFQELFGKAQIDNFYSDSKADLPMARLARHAFFVEGNKVRDWEAMK